MGLTQKILLLHRAAGGSPRWSRRWRFTTFQANRLAHRDHQPAAWPTRAACGETFQADRYNKLRLGVRVLANDPYFKAAVETRRATVLDTLKEREART